MRILTLAILLALAACNTVQGMGRDIESLGEGMQNSSNSAQHQNTVTTAPNQPTQ